MGYDEKMSGYFHSPLVSVIINCYNGQKYLSEAVNSVLSQTYKNWEIIFWDNQSTDGSARIFKNFEDSRLRYFYSPTHTLLYEARNYAIDQASGEFLAFLDVDDWWCPDKLEKQIPLFTDDEVDNIVTQIRNEVKNAGISDTRENCWKFFIDKVRKLLKVVLCF